MRKTCQHVVVLTLAGLVATGIAINVNGWGYHTNRAEIPLLEFVKTRRKPGDLYLLPVNVPKLGNAPRGAAATDFTPPPRGGTHLIAVDLQSFRLYTGAAIFVDFKSVPYQDEEVLEWHRRVMWAHGLYPAEKGVRDWDPGSAGDSDESVP